MKINIYSFLNSAYMHRFLLLLISLYALTFIPYPDIAKSSYRILLIVSLPMLFFDFIYFKKDLVFLLLIFVIFVQVFSWVNSLYYHAEFANDFPKVDRLLKLFGFIFIAYWLRGSIKTVNIVLILFLTGFLIGVLQSPDLINDLHRVFIGKRVDFGIKNAQYTAMLSGVCLIMIIVGLIYLFRSLDKLKTFIIFLYFVTFLTILISSQARQAWLAFISVLLLVPTLVFFSSTNKSWRKLILGYIVFLLSLYCIWNVSAVEKRISRNTFISEKVVVEKIFSGDYHNIPSVGNGIRLNSWIESMGWIKLHPILGSGPNAIGEVIEKSDKFSKKQKLSFNHLHSFHLEILVAYGILGALVIYGMYYWLIRSLVLAHRENPELKMYTVLGICFLIFWIIINFFESFSSRSYGVYVHNIMFGCLYTFYFTQQRKKIEEAEACA